MGSAAGFGAGAGLELAFGALGFGSGFGALSCFGAGFGAEVFCGFGSEVRAGFGSFAGFGVGEGFALAFGAVSLGTLSCLGAVSRAGFGAVWFTLGDGFGADSLGALDLGSLSVRGLEAGRDSLCAVLFGSLVRGVAFGAGLAAWVSGSRGSVERFGAG